MLPGQGLSDALVTVASADGINIRKSCMFLSPDPRSRSITFGFKHLALAKAVPLNEAMR
jgi:hypothetical protein